MTWAMPNVAFIDTTRVKRRQFLRREDKGQLYRSSLTRQQSAFLRATRLEMPGQHCNKMADRISYVKHKQRRPISGWFQNNDVWNETKLVSWLRGSYIDVFPQKNIVYFPITVRKGVGSIMWIWTICAGFRMKGEAIFTGRVIQSFL